MRGRFATFATVVGVVMLVIGFWWRGELFLAANGPTFDEAAYLAAGYHHWLYADFQMTSEHPPLLMMWWALPLFLGERPAFPEEVARATNRNHWQVGIALLYGADTPYTDRLNPARRMNLAIGCGVVLLSGWWAYRSWMSRLAGFAAAALAAADPNLLALSCVLSTDVGFAFFAMLSTYLLSEYASSPSRGWLFAAGMSLGLLLGTKHSAIGMVVALGMTGLLLIVRGDVLSLPGVPVEGRTVALRERLARARDLLIRLGVIAAVTLAATYGFVHFDEWGRGLKFQLTRAAHGDGAFYLCGQISRTGWYHYFLVALALKLPLGLVVAAFASAVLPGMLYGRAVERSSSGIWLFVPPMLFLAAISYSKVDLGVRVVLPSVVFLAVVAARLAALGSRRFLGGALLVCCLVGEIVSNWQATPYGIAYVNELAGGPTGALSCIADSNLDWGQGLPALKKYMVQEGIESVYLSYFGTDRPEAHGIRFAALPGYGRVGPPGGEIPPADAKRPILVVSANNLLGIYLNDPATFSWLRGRSPSAVLGGCLYVFDLTGDADAIDRVRSLILH